MIIDRRVGPAAGIRTSLFQSPKRSMCLSAMDGAARTDAV
jgi:hypothetical protein